MMYKIIGLKVALYQPIKISSAKRFKELYLGNFGCQKNLQSDLPQSLCVDIDRWYYCEIFSDIHFQNIYKHYSNWRKLGLRSCQIKPHFLLASHSCMSFKDPQSPASVDGASLKAIIWHLNYIFCNYLSKNGFNKKMQYV